MSETIHEFTTKVPHWRPRVKPINLAESFGVAGVITIFLLAAGNQLSIRQPRAMNPAAGRLPIFDAGLQRNSARAQQRGANRY